jgi:hypothetical protein
MEVLAKCALKPSCLAFSVVTCLLWKVNALLIWATFFFLVILGFELGLTLARQLFYHLSHSTSCFFLKDDSIVSASHHTPFHNSFHLFWGVYFLGF